MQVEVHIPRTVFLVIGLQNKGKLPRFILCGTSWFTAGYIVAEMIGEPRFVNELRRADVPDTDKGALSIGIDCPTWA